MIKKAPIFLIIVSIMLSVAWTHLFHLSMFAVLQMKNELIDSQNEKIASLSGNKKVEDSKEQNKGWPNNVTTELTLIQGKSFINEKVILDGFNYIDCSFENVTFVYNGGKSGMLNGKTSYPSRMIFETSNKSVEQAIEILRGLGAVRADVFSKRH